MQLVAPVIANPGTIFGVVAALLLWAVGSGFSLWRGTQVLTRALTKAAGRIGEAADAQAFAQHYEAVSADLGRNPILGARWRDYCGSLVLPLSPARPVRATARPDLWFNLSLLRAPQVGVDARYHAALPNLLVGAGLLFTFVGLAAALSTAGGVVSGEAAARNDALKTLLDTASFKFVTSLVGLGLSIVYALFRKRRLQGVEQALDTFLATLEARIPLLTPAALQQEANAVLERQATQLETFSTDLAINLGQVFDQAFDARLGEHIAPLTDAMQRLADGMASRNEDALQTMLDGFLQRLQGGATDRIQDVADSLAGLGVRLEGLQSGLGEAAVRMAQSADAMATRMGEGAEAALTRITDQMGGLVEGLRTVADQTRSAGDEAGQQLAARIEAAAGGFEEAARGVAVTLAGAAESLQARMDHQAETSSARLTTQVETMVAELRTLAESSRAAGQQAFGELADRIASAAIGFETMAGRMAQTFEAAATDTGGAFGKGAEAAVERIAAATEGMRSELQAMMADLRTTLGQAGDALREGGAAGAASLRGSLEDASGGLAAAMGEAAERLAAAGTTASGALVRGGEAAATHLTEAGGAFGSRADGLARQVLTLTQAADSIGVRIAELDRATREVAAPLEAASADLKAAGQSARMAVEPMTQAAQTAGRALEQVAGAAQRLEATAAGVGRLVESLSVAAQRFEGVDKELARTLKELQDGLQGFTRQVSGFVSQTDQNLAKAATQLGSLVKGLQDTIEELQPA
ncbi:hypothetical protein [Microvirga yunnanensis]|uniref:hypothetical protein n=1 Tax=Microvirga yunnanensis TaxID=2953740 RepID=UPI0021C7E624|nr:hypothetical protein [Microvirga sp. HBU65207]